MSDTRCAIFHTSFPRTHLPSIPGRNTFPSTRCKGGSVTILCNRAPQTPQMFLVLTVLQISSFDMNATDTWQEHQQRGWFHTGKTVQGGKGEREREFHSWAHLHNRGRKRVQLWRAQLLSDPLHCLQGGNSQICLPLLHGFLKGVGQQKCFCQTQHVPRCPSTQRYQPLHISFHVPTPTQYWSDLWRRTGFVESGLARPPTV